MGKINEKGIKSNKNQKLKKIPHMKSKTINKIRFHIKLHHHE